MIRIQLCVQCVPVCLILIYSSSGSFYSSKWVSEQQHRISSFPTVMDVIVVVWWFFFVSPCAFSCARCAPALSHYPRVSRCFRHRHPPTRTARLLIYCQRHNCLEWPQEQLNGSPASWEADKSHLKNNLKTFVGSIGKSWKRYIRFRSCLCLSAPLISCNFSLLLQIVSV